MKRMQFTPQPSLGVRTIVVNSEVPVPSIERGHIGR